MSPPDLGKECVTLHTLLMTRVPAARFHRSTIFPANTALHSLPAQDKSSAIAVYAFVGWLMCQVCVLIGLPWLQGAAQGHARLVVLATYWLTFRHVFHLPLAYDLWLGTSVVGFERFLEWWCGLPLSAGWIAVGVLWLMSQVEPALKRRLHASFLRRCYSVLCKAVIATTRLERLHDPYFYWFNKRVAQVLELLRRRCAYELARIERAIYLAPSSLG